MTQAAKGLTACLQTLRSEKSLASSSASLCFLSNFWPCCRASAAASVWPPPSKHIASMYHTLGTLSSSSMRLSRICSRQHVSRGCHNSSQLYSDLAQKASLSTILCTLSIQHVFWERAQCGGPQCPCTENIATRHPDTAAYRQASFRRGAVTTNVPALAGLISNTALLTNGKCKVEDVVGTND